MAKKRTESSRYQSRFSKSYVTAAQYITELICEKHAKFNKKDLIQEFWKLPDWAKHYRQQIPTAYKLLKQFDAAAIINALQSKKAWNIYSLRAPHLIPIIEDEQKIVQAKKDSLATAPEVVIAQDNSFRTNNKKNKLEELDE